MNFLAHLFLSGSDPEVKIGNFIGDYVKGNSYRKYSPGIQRGILLHRRIDGFTDRHPVVRESAMKLQEHYGRYSRIVVDVFYDHFLAVNWHLYSDKDLSRYVTNIHRLLISNYFKLPPRVKRFLPFLVKNRRLEKYRFISGIERSLKIMSSYSTLPDKSGFAITVLENEYDNFDSEFKEFFPEVITLSEQYLSEKEEDL